MNLWAVFTMLFAFIFMGQRLSTIQTAGVLMIVSGVTLASLNWNDIRNQRFQLSAGVKETVFGDQPSWSENFCISTSLLVFASAPLGHAFS